MKQDLFACYIRYVLTAHGKNCVKIVGKSLVAIQHYQHFWLLNFLVLKNEFLLCTTSTEFIAMKKAYSVPSFVNMYLFSRANKSTIKNKQTVVISVQILFNCIFVNIWNIRWICYTDSQLKSRCNGMISLVAPLHFLRHYIFLKTSHLWQLWLARPIN